MKKVVSLCLMFCVLSLSFVTAYGETEGELPEAEGNGGLVLQNGSQVEESDNGSLEESEEVTENETVFPLPPYPVYLVEEPPIEGMEITPMAINDGVYLGPHTATIYQYFRDIAASLPVGVDYVYYRVDQYNYRLVYGKGISLAGTVFTGGAVSVINYYNYTTNNSNRVTRYTDTSFRLTDNGGFVYSSLGGGYPRLFEGVSHRAFEALFFSVLVCAVFTFISRLFASRRG